MAWHAGWGETGGIGRFRSNADVAANPTAIQKTGFDFLGLVCILANRLLHATEARWRCLGNDLCGAEAPEQLRGKNSFLERFAGREVLVAEFDGAGAWQKRREVFPERSWDGNTLLIKDRVLPSLEVKIMNNSIIFIEKQVYKNVTHFGGQIPKGSEVFLRGHSCHIDRQFECDQPQYRSTDFHSAS
jgi:hypothetical protein